MFKTNKRPQSQKDFRVTFLERSLQKVKILIGPRFRVHSIRPINIKQIEDYTDSSSDEAGVAPIGGNIDASTRFEDFYSPQDLGGAFLFHNILLGIGAGKEISKFAPVRQAEDFSLIYGAGEFEIPFKVKTHFWMVVPFGGSVIGRPGSRNFNYATEELLKSNFIHLDYGTDIPSRSSFKYNSAGKLEYTLIIPVLSITPKELSFEVENYDLGQVRYFCDRFVQSSKDRPFWFDRASSYFDE